MESERRPSLRVKYDPWNKRRLTGRKRPQKPKNVWAIRVRLRPEYRKRDLALFNLAIYSKLRAVTSSGCKSMMFAPLTGVRDRAAVIQKKTGRPVQFEITGQTLFSTTAGLPGSTRAMDSTSPRAASGRSHTFRRDSMRGSSPPGSRAHAR
jgi:hypothetical protein